MPCANDFIPLKICVLTISDTRDASTDTSGALLVKEIDTNGHHIADKAIVKDCVYAIREIVSKWIADDNVHAIITTGGTGFTPRDNTPEAISVLFDKNIEGFL